MLSRALTLLDVTSFAGAFAPTSALANPVMPVIKSQPLLHLVADYDYDGPRHERGYRRGWDGDGPRWGGVAEAGAAAVVLFATNARTALVGGLGALTAAWIIEAANHRASASTGAADTAALS
jgi:hypothetical protein